MQYRETFRRGEISSARPSLAPGRRAQAGQAQLQKASLTSRCNNQQVRQPMRPLLVSNRVQQRGTDRHPVVTFLREIGLSQYAASLLQDGFDDIDTLFEIEDAHLKAAGFLPGHILKFKRNIKALQLQEAKPPRPVCVSKPASAQAPAQPRTGTVPSRQTVDAVQKSWLVVKELGIRTVAQILYRHLFRIAPETKALFPMSVRMRYSDWTSGEVEDENDFENSAALRNLFSKVVGAVGSAVAGLQNISTLVAELNALGMRHINYNMREEYFEFGGQALVLTLQDGLGDLLTEEVHQSWVSVYEFISATIICGLRSARSQLDSSKQIAELSPSSFRVPGTEQKEIKSREALQKPHVGVAETAVVPRPLPHAQQKQMVPSGSTISAVQKSWLVVKELGTGTVGEILYRHLFSIAPQTKELFPMSVRSRYRNWANSVEEDENDFINSPALRNLFSKVVDAVGTAVAGLQNISKLVPELNALGMRHINYNMREEYFDFGGQALVLTLQDGLGSMLTEEVQQAWISVYEFISASIISGLKFAREREALLKAVQNETRSLPLSPATSASGASVTWSSTFGRTISDGSEREANDAQLPTLLAASKASARLATLREKRAAQVLQSDIGGTVAP